MCTFNKPRSWSWSFFSEDSTDEETVPRTSGEDASESAQPEEETSNDLLDGMRRLHLHV